MRAVIGGTSMAVMGLALFLAPRASEVPRADGPQRVWVKLVFGLDEQPAVWDGRLEVRDGRALDMAEWGLEERDRLLPESHSWKARSEVPEARQASFAEPLRGILAEIEFDTETVVEVETEQGNFRFAPAELTPGRPATFLDGRVSVEPLGTQQVVAETTTDDDFPAIAVDAQGHRHVAWIAFDEEVQRDRLLVRNVDDANSRPEPIADAEEFAGVRLFSIRENGGDVLRAVWCSPGADGNWDIHTAVRRGDGWQAERLTTADGNDFHLAADLGPDGTLWLAWQSFRSGNGDIYAKSLRDGRWSDDIAVADTPANEWEPAVSVDRKGRAWIAWDSYENGNYDVFLTDVVWDGRTLRKGEKVAVARSDDFEAHASVLADGKGRVWVAYNAAGPNWGKDFRNVATLDGGRYAEPLHASRRLELRCVINGKVHRPTLPLSQVLPPDRIHMIERRPTAKPARFYEYPQLAQDGAGRLWMFFRLCRQGYCPHPLKGAVWSAYATTYTRQGWLEPIELPRSEGRQNQRVAVAAGPDGRLHCAWAEGNRFASVNRKYVVRYGGLADVAERPAELPLEPVDLDPPGTPDPEPQVPWTIARDGKEYQVVFGDLHRHTNISRCAPTIDGSLTDAHRYALDAAELDFLAVTDHARDVDPFSWWRTQKAADLFHVPGRYVPIYAYERSNQAPGGGHRNVFFIDRGHPINPSDHYYLGRGLPRQNADPDTTLYPWLKERDALTAAHTPEWSPAAMRGTWTYHDPQVEPVAEIFQGFRRSYERPDGRLADEASMWFALRQGHRLGFIASSDHVSTHLSYACLWATGRSREAIFEALRSRRTYAATDRIGLDVRVGEALMGEETAVPGKSVTLTIRALGTAPVVEMQVVRSGKVVARLTPDGRHIETQWTDDDPLPGTSHYYVRLAQQDGGLAWGSPIWVRR